MSLIEKTRPGGGAGSPAQPRRRRRQPWLLLLLLLALLGGLWWLRDGGEPAPEPAEAPLAEPAFEPPPLGAAEPPGLEPEPAGAPPAADAPAAAPAGAEPLPAREASDPLARELAARVSEHPAFAGLLEGSGLLDRFVLLVDNLAEGVVPRRQLAFLRPERRFLVLGEPPELRIDPASYRRFDAVTATVASLDAEAAAAAYRRVAPLCEESYRALGYPEGGFETRLRAALAHLLSTPTVDDTPALVAETLRYEFADPALESLSDAQKLLLRIGPENGQRVRAKLREVQTALGPPR